MSHLILNKRSGLAFAFAWTLNYASYAAGSQQTAIIPLTPGTGQTHGSSSTQPGHGVGGSPNPSANTNAYVVPYTCGNNVSSVFIKNALYVQSDQAGDAGYEIYSSQVSPVVPFAPGVLSFNVSGAHNFDQIQIVEFNQNGISNGKAVLLTDGLFSIDLTQLTTAKIKQLICVIQTNTNNESAIVFSNFRLASNPLPLDLTQTAHCSTK